MNAPREITTRPSKYTDAAHAIDLQMKVSEFQTSVWTLTKEEAHAMRDALTARLCHNPNHDHIIEDDEARETGVEVGTTRLCYDCLRPAHYDTRMENYRHDDEDAVCFLIQIQEGWTPCEV